MKKYTGYIPTQITRTPNELGESIEEMIRRATENKEAIESVAPMIYTPRAEGVLPEHDIRTDRQELALDATDKYAASIRARTDENPYSAPTQQTQQTQQDTNQNND